MEKTALYWIEKLGLSEHPEGGYFAPAYRSSERIEESCLPNGFTGDRALVSSIHYLLARGQISALHRLKSVEMWHFYSGDPLSIYILEPNGTLKERTLGPDIDKGQEFQITIEPGCWFGAEHYGPGEYTLVGCTVSPGFEYEDMEFAGRDELLGRYPQHRGLIEKLTIR
jgi:predicted cupin superfamily sugar epimerase